MDFPFAFMQPMFMASPMTMSAMGPMPMSPFAMGQTIGAMPTMEQREEFTLAFLNDQKQQIAKMREYYKECIKSLDASLGVIEEQMSKIDAAKSKRKQSEASTASETRSKR